MDNTTPRPYIIYFGEIDVKVKVNAYNIEEACYQAVLSYITETGIEDPKITGVEPFIKREKR